MTVTTNASSPTAESREAPPAAVSEIGTAPPAEERLVEADLLVEDVSIDGMCGVY